MRLVAAVVNDGMTITVGEILYQPILSDLAAFISNPEENAYLRLHPFASLSTIETIDNSCSDAASWCKLSKDLVIDIYPRTPLQEGLRAHSKLQGHSWLIMCSHLKISRSKESEQVGKRSLHRILLC